MWRDIKKKLHQSSEFLLTTHLNPDGDGLGAACAMIELLLHMNKRVRFVCDSPIPSKFSFLDYHQLFETYDMAASYEKCQVLIVLDTHQRDRIGRLAKLIDQPGIVTICIDHHKMTETFADYHAIDAEACSAGAMVYALCKEMHFHLNMRAATGIYASIICDTGRFSYSSTGRQAHKIADECIRLGVDPDLMHSKLFQHVSLAEIKVFASALQGLETYLDNRVVIEQIRKEDCEKLGKGLIDLEHVDLEYIHDFNNLIEDVQCFVLLRELADNHVRVSLRSKPDLDVSHLMHSLGGGGHASAAGLTWKGSVKDIKELILNLLSKQFERQEQKVIK